MAMLFSILLGISAIILGYFIYAYKNGEYIDATHIAISTNTYESILWLGILIIFLMSAVVVISFFISVFCGQQNKYHIQYRQRDNGKPAIFRAE